MEDDTIEVSNFGKLGWWEIRETRYANATPIPASSPYRWLGATRNYHPNKMLRSSDEPDLAAILVVAVVNRRRHYRRRPVAGG